MGKERIIFQSKFENARKIDDRFTVADCYVCATGKNRNGSHISKDSVDRALHSLWNVPVVAHLYEDKDGNKCVGGHDRIVVQDKDGNYVFKSLCVPYGVVPKEPDKAEYVDIEEPDGRGVHTYLKTPIILWTERYPELTEAYLSNEGALFSQSMEIEVYDCAPLEEDKNYNDIKEFEFSALTLLGEDVEPCFPMSKVTESEFSIDESFTQLFSQLKSELAECFGNSQKGTEEQMENTNIPAENQAAPQAEVTETQFSEETAQAAQEEPTAQAQPESFGATYKELRSALENMFTNETVRDEDGNVVKSTYYWIVDFDDKVVYVEKSVYTAEDSGEELHFMVPYAYEEATHTASITGDFIPVTLKWLTQEEIDALDAMKAELEELKNYKCDREEKDRKACCDEAMSEFSDMAGNEAYDEVYENRYNYESVDALKNACYVIRGKFALYANRPTTCTVPSVPVQTHNSPVETTRDRFHAEYGRK